MGSGGGGGVWELGRNESGDKGVASHPPQHFTGFKGRSHPSLSWFLAGRTAGVFVSLYGVGSPQELRAWVTSLSRVNSRAAATPVPGLHCALPPTLRPPTRLARVPSRVHRGLCSCTRVSPAVH